MKTIKELKAEMKLMDAKIREMKNEEKRKRLELNEYINERNKVFNMIENQLKTK